METELDCVRESLVRIKNRGESLAQHVYMHLFDLDPGLKMLFSGNMDQQSATLDHMINAAVQMSQNPQHLAATFRELGARHRQYTVRPQDFDTLQSALLAALKDCLGDMYDDRTESSWKTLYQFWTSQMTTGMNQSSW